MKKNIIKILALGLGVFIVNMLVGGAEAQATALKVDKVKGNKAAVSAQEEITWKAGDTIKCEDSLSQDSELDDEPAPVVKKGSLRKRDRGFTGSISNTTTSSEGSSTSTNSMSLSALYMFNMEKY